MAKINHLGIIVDGNGRWAKERGLNRSEGHLAGANNLEKLIKYILKKDIANYLSLYLFSTENFGRSKEEVDYLMNLFLKWFKKIQKENKMDNVKLLFSGRKELLKRDIVTAMNTLEEKTKNNKGLVINMCLSYGGRCELVDATKKISQLVLNGDLDVENINEEILQKNLYHNLPDIDFLIRTSGENRISNFMLWQLSYAELYFPKTFFPDFDADALDEAVKVYESRDRRFGKIKDQN